MSKSYISPLVEIRASKTHGKGMFAKKDILKGTIIYRWAGTFLDKKEVLKLDKDKYIIIQVEQDLWSVEPRASPEDDTYFINHSCNPNVWMDNGVTFSAKRNIRKGEELTVDYAMFVSEDYVSKWECKCRSKNCRKTITGKDYLLKDLQKRYKNHFS